MYMGTDIITALLLRNQIEGKSEAKSPYPAIVRNTARITWMIPQLKLARKLCRRRGISIQQKGIMWR